MINNPDKNNHAQPAYIRRRDTEEYAAIFERYQAEKQRMLQEGTFHDSKLRIFEDNTNRLCLSVLVTKEEGFFTTFRVYRAKEDLSFGHLSILRKGNEREIASVEINLNESGKGIGGLLLSQAMDYLTEYQKTNNFYLIAAGEHIAKHLNVKNDYEVEYSDKIKHREDLIRFYGQYGFNLLNFDREPGVEMKMQYDPAKGYPKPVNFSIGGNPVWMARPKTPLKYNLLGNEKE